MASIIAREVPKLETSYQYINMKRKLTDQQLGSLKEMHRQAKHIYSHATKSFKGRYYYKKATLGIQGPKKPKVNLLHNAEMLLKMKFKGSRGLKQL